MAELLEEQRESWGTRVAFVLAAIGSAVGLADGAEIEETTAPIRDRLSGVSYIILAVVFLIIIGGLGWCFYKALAAASGDTGIQYHDEIGDERQRI